MGRTHHGFVNDEYRHKRTPNVNRTIVIELMCPILFTSQPEMKKNGSSPPKHCTPRAIPCNVFINSCWPHLKLFHTINHLTPIPFEYSFALTRFTGLRQDSLSARTRNSTPRPCTIQLQRTKWRTRRFESIWIAFPHLWLNSMTIRLAWTANE